MMIVNGTFQEGTRAEFDFSDRGFTLSDGLFETMVVLAGEVFMRAAHLDRMEHGMRVLGFTVARSRLENDLAAMIARTPDGYGVLRLTVTRGSGARGLMPPVGPKPTVVVTYAPFNPALVMEPTTLATVSIRRNDQSPTSRLKTLMYLDNIMALREAGEHGARDCLMLNTQGNVACASAANIFMIKDGKLITPPIDDGVLPGIGRMLVLNHADEIGLDPVEASIRPDELKTAEQVFLTNSVRYVQPVARIDSTLFEPDLVPIITRCRHLKKVLNLYSGNGRA